MKEIVIQSFTVVIPLVSVVIAWLLNERGKRRFEEYAQKKLKYENMIEASNGFYVNHRSKDDIHRFTNELRKSWLYASDQVIKKTYEFLGTVHTGTIQSDEIKEKAFAEMIVAMREDLMSGYGREKTTLTSKDYKHYFENSERK